MENTRNSIHVPIPSPPHPHPLSSFLQNSFCMCFVGSLSTCHTTSPISKRCKEFLCKKFRPCRVPMPSQMNICEIFVIFGKKERNVSCFQVTVQVIRIQHYDFTRMNQILATSVKNYINCHFTRFLILQGS
jgi:hypothetical protein